MTEATQPDPPTSTQLTDFWQALNDPEEEPATTTTAQPDSLTLADIPAGQGPASLFLESRGRLALWFKAADDTHHFVRWAPIAEGRPHDRALWEHLIATLHTVRTEERA